MTLIRPWTWTAWGKDMRKYYDDRAVSLVTRADEKVAHLGRCYPFKLLLLLLLLLARGIDGICVSVHTKRCEDVPVEALHGDRGWYWSNEIRNVCKWTWSQFTLISLTSRKISAICRGASTHTKLQIYTHEHTHEHTYTSCIQYIPPADSKVGKRGGKWNIAVVHCKDCKKKSKNSLIEWLILFYRTRRQI